MLVLVSQPLTALPSQLPKPALHVGTHAPDVQVVEPFAFTHCVVQAPQLERLVLVLVSQPFEALPSQLPKPAVQALSRLAFSTHEVHSSRDAFA